MGLLEFITCFKDFSDLLYSQHEYSPCCCVTGNNFQVLQESSVMRNEETGDPKVVHFSFIVFTGYLSYYYCVERVLSLTSYGV